MTSQTGAESPAGQPYPVPVGQTARRLEWSHLPPAVRSQIASRCGADVVHAHSMGTGFTPGFASVLTCADGSKHFVKAASSIAQRAFADAYRAEARALTALPAEVAAPALLWAIDGDWVVLGIEYVAATPPARPWRLDELNACLDMLERTAAVLTPPPAGLELSTIADEFATWPDYWRKTHISDVRLRAKLRAEQLSEAAALAAEFARHTVGETVLHTDVRDDNLLIAATGEVQLCDWNWMVMGAPWVDTVMALIGPRGDGIDVERVLEERALTRDVDPAAIDSLLALVAGYFFHSAEQPVPSTSPWIREHQGWYRDVVWDWLHERRGW